MYTESRNSATHTLNIIMLWLFIVTAALLFLPWAKVSADIAARVAGSRLFLYFALLFEVSNFISQLLICVVSNLIARKTEQRRIQRLEESVDRLDFSERALLREFVLQRKSVLNLPLEEPTVRGLIDTGIMTVIGYEDENGKTPVMISRQARPLISYKVLGLSKCGMSEEQISKIMDERPAYAKPVTVMPKSYRGSRLARAA